MIRKPPLSLALINDENIFSFSQSCDGNIEGPRFAGGGMKIFVESGYAALFCPSFPHCPSYSVQ